MNKLPSPITDKSVNFSEDGQLCEENLVAAIEDVDSAAKSGIVCFASGMCNENLDEQKTVERSDEEKSSEYRIEKSAASKSEDKQLGENFNLMIKNTVDSVELKVKPDDKIDEDEKGVKNKNESSANNVLPSSLTFMSRFLRDKLEVDSRSIYVGNVDYRAKIYHLKIHFRHCGTINRITILRNRNNGRSKEFAFIEFFEKRFAEVALAKNETIFWGRRLKVMPKHTIRPVLSSGTNNNYGNNRTSQRIYD